MNVKKNKSNPAWVLQHINDPYVKKAQAAGYRARAAFKLKELNDEFKLIQPGMTVVDLGSAPGSWSQVVREILSSKRKPQVDNKSPIDTSGIFGRVIALDLLPMDSIPHVDFIQGDFREDEVLTQLQNMLGNQKVDLVLSDMAPNLSGIASVDAARIEYLSELALSFAQEHLKDKGALLIKTFHGAAYDKIVKNFRQQFVQVQIRKPKASRSHSAETFILGRHLK